MRIWIRAAIHLSTLLVPVVMMAASQEPTPWQELNLVDLDGRAIDPLSTSRARATVFIFTRTDCPISNRYAPEIRRLRETFEPDAITFFLVYLDGDESSDSIREHLADYDLALPALRDPGHRLVALTGAEVTPEAAVFDASHRLVYRGRIDDRYVTFGTTRPAPTQRDLQEALQQIMAGETLEPRTTRAVGCYIQDLQ